MKSAMKRGVLVVYKQTTNQQGGRQNADESLPLEKCQLKYVKTHTYLIFNMKGITFKKNCSASLGFPAIIRASNFAPCLRMKLKMAFSDRDTVWLISMALMLFSLPFLLNSSRIYNSNKIRFRCIYSEIFTKFGEFTTNCVNILNTLSVKNSQCPNPNQLNPFILPEHLAGFLPTVLWKLSPAHKSLTAPLHVSHVLIIQTWAWNRKEK